MSPRDKIDLRRWQAGDVLRIAGVRQLVEHGDVHMRMVPRHVSREVRANEAVSARPRTARAASPRRLRTTAPACATPSRTTGSWKH